MPAIMLDLGRSTDSSRTGSRDLLEMVIDNKEDDHHRQTEPRIATLLVRNNFELGKPVRPMTLSEVDLYNVRSWMPFLSVLLRMASKRCATFSYAWWKASYCRRSPNLSRQSLASDPPELDRSKLPCLNAFIHSLGLFSVSSLVLAALSFAVLSGFINMQLKPQCSLIHSSEGSENGGMPTTLPKTGYTNTSNDTMDNALIKAGFALSSFVLSSCLCCLMVCSMQCFFTSKILKTVDGDERAHKFIRECSSSRVIAVTGFFFSIPAFSFDIVVLLMLRVSYSQAIVAGVILGLGVLFCVLSVMQNCYHWRVEKSRADEGLPVYDSHFSFPRSAVNRCSPRNNPELCTLV